MKKETHIPKKILFGLLLVAAWIQSPAQDKKAEKEAVIKTMLETQDFVFKAQSALPMSMRSRMLTSDYDVKISKNSIVSYLPYFGRAYTASMDPSEGGIQFTSTDFTYSKTDRKKGGWDLMIKPKDNTDVQQMSFSITRSGVANLEVTLSNKQPISFTGYITAGSKK